MKRINYIDNMKGIAIILVLLFHTINLTEEVACIINTLHNPSFYLASGILLAGSLKHKKEEKEFKKFFFNKILSLLYPFLLWVLIYSTISFLIRNRNTVTFYSQLVTSVNRLWFLPTLFFSSSIIYVYYKHTKNPLKLEKHQIAIYALCFLISLYSSLLGKIAFYTYIMWIGFHIANSNFKYIKSYLIMPYFLFVICFFVFNDGYIHLNDTVVPGIKLSLFLSLSILGSLAIFFLSQKISFSILSWFGKNSLYFYVLHFLALEIRDILTQYIPYSKILFSFGLGIITFLLALLIPSLFIALCKKKTAIRKILFGK